MTKYDGQYLGMSSDEYHGTPAISRSVLSKLDKAPTPAHFLESMKATKKTNALRFGSAFHAFLLEPDLYKENAIKWTETISTDTVKFTKAEDELEDGKFLVPAAWEPQMISMAEAILSIPKAKSLLNLKGLIEPSYFWHDDEFDIDVKARPDYLAKGIILDLKTTESADDPDFAKSIIDYNYDIQVHMNMVGIEKITGDKPSAFVFCTVEKNAPFCARLFVSGEDVLLSGKIKYEKLMRKYISFKDRFDGYDVEPKEIYLPSWYMTKLLGE